MNETYTINGVTKSFLDWCQEYDVSPLQVRAMVSLGMLMGDALQAKKRVRVVLFSLNGQTKSLTEWCQMYGIDSSTFRKRIKAGYTLQEALEAGRHGVYRYREKVKKEPEHTITRPFLDWCQDYGVEPLRVRAAMSQGYSLLHALKTAPKGRVNQLVMQVDGVTDTFLHLCSMYKKAPNTVRRRVAAGLMLEDAFGIPLLPKDGAKLLTEAGRANEEYSITQPLDGWCRDYRVPPAVVQLRLKLGSSIERAIRRFTLEEVNKNSREITITELCEALGTDAARVLENMAQGMDLFDALAAPCKNK